MCVCACVCMYVCVCVCVSMCVRPHEHACTTAPTGKRCSKDCDAGEACYGDTEVQFLHLGSVIASCPAKTKKTPGPAVANVRRPYRPRYLTLNSNGDGWTRLVWVAPEALGCPTEGGGTYEILWRAVGAKPT